MLYQRKVFAGGFQTSRCFTWNGDYLRELNRFEKGYEPFAGPPEIVQCAGLQDLYLVSLLRTQFTYNTKTHFVRYILCVSFSSY